MPNTKRNESDKLKHIATVRLNDATYAHLQRLLEGNPNNDISRIIRDIICSRPVKIFLKDTSHLELLSELAQLRYEINKIGVNINQITKLFNTFPEAQLKVLFARSAFNKYQAIEPKIDRLLAIVSKLSKKWLSE